MRCWCRQESECVLQLKGLTPSGALPIGILSSGREGLHSTMSNALMMQETTTIQGFEDAKTLDRVNERMPPTRAGAGGPPNANVANTKGPSSSGSAMLSSNSLASSAAIDMLPDLPVGAGGAVQSNCQVCITPADAIESNSSSSVKQSLRSWRSPLRQAILTFHRFCTHLDTALLSPVALPSAYTRLPTWLWARKWQVGRTPLGTRRLPSAASTHLMYSLFLLLNSTTGLLFALAIASHFGTPLRTLHLLSIVRLSVDEMTNTRTIYVYLCFSDPLLVVCTYERASGRLAFVHLFWRFVPVAYSFLVLFYF